ncbi:MAG TPA: phospholipase, partial [Chryseobacterium sp.]|nr:phospholipase [Chryseobacterium sp.]
MDLSYLVREPQNITPETPLLILLHGYGSNEQDLFS